MRQKKSSIGSDELIVMALANFICAEAGRSGDLSRNVDISTLSATLGASEKDRKAAYKRAKKTLALFT